MRLLTKPALLGLALALLTRPAVAQAPAGGYVVNDSHFHLTNYV